MFSNKNDANALRLPPFAIPDEHDFSGHDFSASFDFAKLFEEEYPIDGPLSSHVPNPLLSLAQDDHYRQQQQHQNNKMSLPQAETRGLPSQGHETADPLVNVVMVVDPVTQKVICPQQVLSFTNTDGKVEQTVFGPITLDSITSDSVGSVSHHALSPTMASPQGHFKPIASRPPTTISPEMNPKPLESIPPVLSGKVSPTDSSVGCGVPTSAAVAAPGPSTPVRALSAYNFFFRDERDRIIQDGEVHEEFNNEKQVKLLKAHWHRDRTKKRRHRKTHGKIAFTTLSKLISQRWKDLDDDKREFYRQVAAKDWERYQRELSDYKRLTAATSKIWSSCS